MPAAAARPFEAVPALGLRLRAVVDLLGATVPGPFPDDPLGDSTAVLDALARRVHAGGDVRELWLLLTAAGGTLPTEREVLTARRALELDDARASMRVFLDAVAGAGAEHELQATLPVQRGVVVDAGHTALVDMHTGIQRVVREVMRRWDRQHDVQVAAWSRGYRTLRSLTPQEHARVCAWEESAVPAETAEHAGSVVLPWQSTVLVPELPPERERVDRLRALARFSGNRLVLVGYDAIPLTSAEAVNLGAASNFAAYLSAVKHADRVVAISRSAGEEFRGFAAMLAAQGLEGPDVRVCALPTDVPPAAAEQPVDPQDLPVVLAVGTLEPRKNQLVVLHAAEKLWRQGKRFRLVLIGGAGQLSGEILDRARALEQAGRPVDVRTRVGDAELWRTIRQARFTVFVSVHEGYGLPVAESLACGTPVLTTGHGSTGEVAAGGGALLVDPRDEPAVAREMGRLLDDDQLVAELRRQAAARPVRTWDDYAAELWRSVTTAGAARA